MSAAIRLNCANQAMKERAAITYESGHHMRERPREGLCFAPGRSEERIGHEVWLAKCTAGSIADSTAYVCVLTKN